MFHLQGFYSIYRTGDKYKSKPHPPALVRSVKGATKIWQQFSAGYDVLQKGVSFMCLISFRFKSEQDINVICSKVFAVLSFSRKK